MEQIIIPKFGKREAITYKDLFEAFEKYGQSPYLGLNMSNDTFRKHMKRLYPNKPITSSWINYILSLSNMKRCSACGNIKTKPEFNAVKTSIDNLSYECTICKNGRDLIYRKNNLEKERQRSKEHYKNNKSYYIEKDAKRRAYKLKAVPIWANFKKIKLIYKLRPKDYHVDHIIPLKGKSVCGLHVEYNLQYLLAKENLKKGNKHYDN